MTSLMVSKKYVQASPFPVNRWGIPYGLCLRGGGENTSDYGTPVKPPGWVNNNNLSGQNQFAEGNNQSTMSDEQSTNGKNGQRFTSPQQNNTSGTQQSKQSGAQLQNVPTSSSSSGGSSSWAQVAGKGISTGSSSSDEDKLQCIKEALLSTEGWGGENVNQESSWDLPPSPEPGKDSSLHSKAPVNDGCELWKNAKHNNEGASAVSSSHPNVWNHNSSSGDKGSEGSNNWFNYPPMSQQWRGHPNDNQPPNLWTGQKNPTVIEESPPDWTAPKNPTSTSASATHSIPLPVSQSGSAVINNPYPLGPFPHMDAQNLPGGVVPSSGTGLTPNSHKLSSAHLLLEQGNGNGATKETRPSPWDGLVSIPKEAQTSSWGSGPGPQPLPPKWIGLPNHSLPERHMVTSTAQGPIMAPPLPHGLIKPDQIMWSQINPAGDFHHDLGPGNWPNNVLSSGCPPNYKAPPAIPDPNSEDLDLSVVDALKKISQENSQPIPAFISQIQLAVQAGFLNHHILNQPLAPSSLLLLNQMLSSISFLHKLLQQQNLLNPQIHVNKNAHQQVLQLNVHINKTKQQIQHLQNQVTNQQALYLKQQQHQSHPVMPTQPPLLPNLLGPPNVQNEFKNNFPDHLLMNFNQMNLRDSSSNNASLQNDPSKWKQLLPGSYSSGIPREHVKNNMKSHPSSSQIPYMLNSDSSWPQAKNIDQGWSQNMPNRPAGPSPPSSGAGTSGHESFWPSSQQQGVQHSYELDIKPFEPGKPWMQMKNLEDGFDFPPGPVNHSSIGMPETEHLNTMGKHTPHTSSDISGTGSFSSIPLNSSTWTFNPNSQGSSSNTGEGKAASQAVRSKESWGNGPRGTAPSNNELWVTSGTKSQNVLPNASRKTNPNQPWGAIGRSTSWAGNGARTSSGSALHSPQWSSPQPTSTWLILKNLTPEIDGSTLKTLCLQHGPLVTFHLSLNHGFALVNYGSREEAAKAQGNLNNCLLSNTTILAEFASEPEVTQLLGAGVPTGVPTSSWGGTGRGSTPTSQAAPNNKADSWGSSGGGGGGGGSSLWDNGPSGGSSLWSGSTFVDGDQHRVTPSSLKSYLPDGLLNSETM